MIKQDALVSLSKAQARASMSSTGRTVSALLKGAPPTNTNAASVSSTVREVSNKISTEQLYIYIYFPKAFHFLHLCYSFIREKAKPVHRSNVLF